MIRTKEILTNLKTYLEIISNFELHGVNNFPVQPFPGSSQPPFLTIWQPIQILYADDTYIKLNGRHIVHTEQAKSRMNLNNFLLTTISVIY